MNILHSDLDKRRPSQAYIPTRTMRRTSRLFSINPENDTFQEIGKLATVMEQEKPLTMIKLMKNDETINEEELE